MVSSAKIDVKVDDLSGFIGMSQLSHHRLFQEQTFNQALKGFLFPVDIADRHQKFLQWIQALESGTLDAVKETSLHGDFLKDVFQDALGYRSVIGGAGHQWELHAEQTISDGGGSALPASPSTTFCKRSKNVAPKVQATLAPKTSKLSAMPTATMPTPFSSAAATA